MSASTAPLVPATLMLPVGLLITGWTARSEYHWIVPDIGIMIVGGGLGLNYQTITIYVIDAFPLYAASGLVSIHLQG